jgi:hypothetical protein
MPDIIEYDRYAFDSGCTDLVEQSECELPEKVNVERKSLDHTVNQNGIKLINMCRRLNLYIVNGRVGEDKEHGQFTCKSASVIYYMIATADLFKHITHFEVKEANCLLSDVHNPVACTLKKLHEPPSDEKVNTHSDANQQKMAQVLVEKMGQLV